MKRLTSFIIIPLFAALLISMAVPALSASAGSPRATEGTADSEQQRYCNNTYNGKTINGDKLTAFRESTCAARNGGICTGAPAGNGAKVTCKLRDSATTVGGSTNTVASTASDPAVAAAADCNKNGCNIIKRFVNPTIMLLSYLVGLAVTIGIIIGGIQVSSSAGDPQKSASGKKHIQNALIALVAYVVLFAFLQFLIPGGIV